jgi:hypothetical protein
MRLNPRLDVRTTQFAVGQGSFQFCSIELTSMGNSGSFSYVYDCGSISKRHSLKTEIDSLVSELRNQSKNLDLVFISHAHEDHLNGLPHLLDKATGVVADVVVMPLLSPVDRLIGLASAQRSSARRGSRFFRSFMIDPLGALAGLGVKRVIQISASGLGQEYLEVGGEPPSLDNVNQEQAPRLASGWSITGRERLSAQSASDRGRVADDSAFEIEIGGFPLWLLVPYVDPGVTRHHEKFLELLAKSLGRTKEELLTWLTRPGSIEVLAKKHRRMLRHCYEKISNLNGTSMSLYSGPRFHPNGRPEITPVFSGYAGNLGFARRSWIWWCVSRYHRRQNGGRIAWLSSGDSELGELSSRSAFLAHYSRVLSTVGTFVLPHHGSEPNFDVGLLRAIQPNACISSSASKGKWRHPAKEVVDEIETRGILIARVNEILDTRLDETVRVI